MPMELRWHFLMDNQPIIVFYQIQIYISIWTATYDATGNGWRSLSRFASTRELSTVLMTMSKIASMHRVQTKQRDLREQWESICINS